MTGSTVKVGICGYGFLNKLANAGADRIRYNQEMSNDLGMDVAEFTVSGGGKIMFLPDFEMSRMGKDEELYITDVQYLQYMYLQGEDIRIDKGKDGKGLQANDEKKTKHQIYGVIGLKRTFKDSHFHFYGIT